MIERQHAFVVSLLMIDQDGKMCNYSKRLLASSVTQMIVLINKLKETGNAIPSEELND
jgi:hypothetical protein